MNNKSKSGAEWLYEKYKWIPKVNLNVPHGILLQYLDYNISEMEFELVGVFPVKKGDNLMKPYDAYAYLAFIKRKPHFNEYFKEFVRNYLDIFLIILKKDKYIFLEDNQENSNELNIISPISKLFCWYHTFKFDDKLINLQKEYKLIFNEFHELYRKLAEHKLKTLNVSIESMIKDKDLMEHNYELWKNRLKSF